MGQMKILIQLVIGLALLGSTQPVSCAVKDTVPNIEALWHQFLERDAAKIPTIRFPYDHCFKTAARKNNLPLSLLLAVARGESNFNPTAKSDRNCHGLMQIQWPGTAKHLGIYRKKALYEPCTNVRAGARYLRELLDRYSGNVHLALAAYNYGPGRIKNRSSAANIPHGAKWYSGYIYHHMEYVLRGATPVGPVTPLKPKTYRQPKRFTLITFNQPYRAMAYYQHLSRKAPGLNLDWYRIGRDRYRVVMLYTDKKTKESGRAILRNLGVMVRKR